MDHPSRPAWIVEAGWIAVAVVALAALTVRWCLPLVTADGLLPVLMSTYKLTMYYWGQDRLANLVPLLASPVHSALWNLKIQVMVQACSFFAVIAMFVWFHLRWSNRPRQPWTIAVATAMAGLLALELMRPRTAYILALEQPYGLSLSLFLAGCHLLVSGHWARFALGSVAVIAATFLNPTALLMTPVLLLLCEKPRAQWARLALASAVPLIAFGLNLAASHRFYSGPSEADRYGDFSVSRSFDGVGDTIRTISDSMRAATPVVAVLLVIAVGALLVRLPWRLRLAYVAVPLYALAWVVLFSGNLWVVLNLNHFRYFFPVYAAGLLAAAVVCSEITVRVGAAIVARRRRLPGDRRALVLAAAAVVTVVAGFVAVNDTAVPEIEARQAQVDAVRQADAELVVGTYWTTWPLVIAARDQGVDVLGISERSFAIKDDITEIATRESADEPLRVVCVERDPPACAAEVSAFTGVSFAAGDVVVAQPLIIELVRQQPPPG